MGTGDSFFVHACYVYVMQFLELIDPSSFLLEIFYQLNFIMWYIWME